MLLRFILLISWQSRILLLPDIFPKPYIEYNIKKKTILYIAIGEGVPI